MALYGKNKIVELISSMIINDRLSHSFILIGEKGLGRLTLAKHMAKMILCQGASKPCNGCKSCRIFESGGHPDLNILTPSGKSENFRADDLRFLISDASVSANEGGYKVYILPEIDKALPVAQNVLLKIIEEPPAKVVFIMTATSKEKILQTVQSRSVALTLPRLSDDDCLAILEERGYNPIEAKKTVERMGANPGKCIDALEGSGDNSAFEAAERVMDGLISADEYTIAKELAFFEGDRLMATSAISVLQSVIRDAIVIKSGGGKLYSPMKDKAEILAKNVRTRGLQGMYEAMTEAASRISGSGGMSLTLANLACKLKTYSLK